MKTARYERAGYDIEFRTVPLCPKTSGGATKRVTPLDDPFGRNPERGSGCRWDSIRNAEPGFQVLDFSKPFLMLLGPDLLIADTLVLECDVDEMLDPVTRQKCVWSA